MQLLLDTLMALLASYGIVFLIWWLVALIHARYLSSNFFVHVQTTSDITYLNWLKFAGIFPPTLAVKEDDNGTGTDDN